MQTLYETGVVIELAELQADAERRQVDAGVFAREPLLGEAAGAREYKGLNCILSDHHVVHQRRKRGIGLPLPSQVVVRGRGREDLEGDDNVVALPGRRIVSGDSLG